MPFLFENEQNNKWLSFDDNSLTFNGRNIVLSQCDDCLDKTEIANMPDGINSGSKYKIRYKNNCLVPDVNDGNKIIEGSCNDDHSIFLLKKPIQSKLLEMDNQLKVSIAFNDNKTGNINSKTQLWSKEIANESHTPNGDASTIKSYHVIGKNAEFYQGDTTNKIETPSMYDYIFEDIEIKCRVFNVIEEYDKSSRLLSKKIYKLSYKTLSKIGDIANRDNKNILGAIVYVESNLNEMEQDTASSGNDIWIKYIGRKKYKDNPKKNINETNYYRAYIGIKIKDIFFNGYVNTSSSGYAGGILIQKRGVSTVFRIIPIDNIFNKIIKYSYPSQLASSRNSKSLPVNLSSFINPSKKIYINKKGQAVTANLNDGAQSKTSIFNLEPVDTRVDRGVEGFANSNVPSIFDNVGKLKQILNGTNASSFDRIIRAIDSIVNIIETENNQDYYAHTQSLKVTLERLKICFSSAMTAHANVKQLHKIMTMVYSNIRMTNIYGGNEDSQSSYNLSSTLQSYAVSAKQSLKNLKANVQIFKQKYDTDNEFNTSIIELNSEFIGFMINTFRHFVEKQTSIESFTNSFLDYNADHTGSGGALGHKTFTLYSKNAVNHVKSTENFSVPSYIDHVKKLIQNGSKYVNTPKAFFDIDFGDIFNQLYVNASNPQIKRFNKNHIEKILHKEKSITDKFAYFNGQSGIMHHYHNFLISQQEYLRKFNTLKELKGRTVKYINGMPASTPSALRNIIKYCYDECVKVPGQELMRNELNFFKILKYYGEQINIVGSNDTNSHKNIFAGIFRNLRYLQETNKLIPEEVSYSQVNNDLHLYYKTKYYVNKKYEYDIINTFMKKYSLLANQVEASIGEHGEIISINNPNLMGTSNDVIEGFTTSFQTTADYHSSDLSFIDTSNYNTNLLNDAFRYTYDNDSNLNLGEYLDKKFVNGSYDSGSQTVSCDNSSASINIIATYNCGSEAQDKVSANISPDIFTCNGGTAFSYDVKLVGDLNADKDDCNVKLVMYDVDRILDEYILKTIPNVSTNVLTQFTAESNPLTSITTNYVPGGNSTVTFLSSLDTTKFLYSDDYYFRLFIDSTGNLKLEYKYRVGLQVTNYSGNSSIPTYGMSNETGNIASIYTTQNKEVGSLVNKSIYIDSAGQAHIVKPDKLNTSLASFTHDADHNKYQAYPDHCYDGTLPTTEITHGDAIGKFETTSSSSSSTVYFNRTELDKFYSGENDCVGSDLNGTLYLKKNQFDKDYKSCERNPENVGIIDISGYNDFVPTASSLPELQNDSVCDKKHIYSKAITNFKQERSDFKDKFVQMIEAFNELNESELNMLEQTDANIDELKNTIKEYTETYDKADKNKNMYEILHGQTADSKIVMNKSQYNIALMGVGAIGATIMMFNYMKK